jgi:hypothetical protein
VHEGCIFAVCINAQYFVLAENLDWSRQEEDTDELTFTEFTAVVEG